MHPRIRIRNVAQQALASKMAEPVHASRVFPLTPEELPAVLVFCQEETVDTKTLGKARLQERRCHLIVECYSSLIEDLEDDLDRMCEAVEQTLFSGVFDGFAKSIQLLRTDMFDVDKGERPVGCARVIFEILHYTREGTPEITG